MYTMCLYICTGVCTYNYMFCIYIMYRKRFVSPRIPRKSSGTHPWILDFEAKSNDYGPQNTGFETVFRSFL